MTGRIILTAAEMRAAEEAAIAAGTPVEELMERAGKAAAEAIWRFAGPLPALVLCGPGNNGGDGYVIARELARARRRRAGRGAGRAESAGRAPRGTRWNGPVEALAEAGPAPLLIDALFGTGLARPLDGRSRDACAELAAQAAVRVAIDLPSGVATDDGAILSPVPDYDLTVTFQTLKPSHLLQPAARHMGRLVVADIGIRGGERPRSRSAAVAARARARRSQIQRGYVAVLAGEMPGASALAAAAALRAGAGYVRLIGPQSPACRTRIVQGPGDPETLLADERIGAVAVGPGPGQEARQAERLLDLALALIHLPRRLGRSVDVGDGRHRPPGRPQRIQREGDRRSAARRA